MHTKVIMIVFVLVFQSVLKKRQRMKINIPDGKLLMDSLSFQKHTHESDIDIVKGLIR